MTTGQRSATRERELACWERVRELEADNQGLVLIKQAAMFEKNDWKARAEKAEARISTFDDLWAGGYKKFIDRLEKAEARAEKAEADLRIERENRARSDARYEARVAELERIIEGVADGDIKLEREAD